MDIAKRALKIGIYVGTARVMMYTMGHHTMPIAICNTMLLTELTFLSTNNEMVSITVDSSTNSPYDLLLAPNAYAHENRLGQEELKRILSYWNSIVLNSKSHAEDIYGILKELPNDYSTFQLRAIIRYIIRPENSQNT